MFFYDMGKPCARNGFEPNLLYTESSINMQSVSIDDDLQTVFCWTVLPDPLNFQGPDHMYPSVGCSSKEQSLAFGLDLEQFSLCITSSVVSSPIGAQRSTFDNTSEGKDRERIGCLHDPTTSSFSPAPQIINVSSHYADRSFFKNCAAFALFLFAHIDSGLIGYLCRHCFSSQPLGPNMPFGRP